MIVVYIMCVCVCLCVCVITQIKEGNPVSTKRTICLGRNQTRTSCELYVKVTPSSRQTPIKLDNPTAPLPFKESQSNKITAKQSTDFEKYFSKKTKYKILKRLERYTK